MNAGDAGVAVARLLEGLHDRGLAIGTDDARRIAAVFRHAEGWSHRRRIRTLKALIARSEEERQIVEQLAPFLFVRAEKVAEVASVAPAGTLARSSESAAPTEAASPLPLPESRPKQDNSRRQPRGARPSRWRIGWRAILAAFAAAALLVVLAVAIRYWRSSTVSPAEPPPPPITDQAKKDEKKDEKKEELLPCPFLDPPGQAAWPFGLLVALGLIPPLMTLWFARVSRRQARNIEVLAASGGPRTYRLELPERYPVGPISAGAAREVAFQLSGPVAETAAPWLDVPQTVDETTRSGGQIVLRYDRWREHRPIVFIEDVGPDMAAFRAHGPQLRAALTGQGAEVQALFMDGTPDRLSPRLDLVGARPFDEVLDLRHEPILLIFSDARALAAATLERAPWLPLLSRAIWLHPAPSELWHEGARALSRHATIVPATEAGLERLSPNRSEAPGTLSSRWRPAAAAGAGAEQRIRLWRAALGDATFFWLAGAAVLARLGQARAPMLWAMRSESITGPLAEAPAERAHRVFVLDGLSVTPDGSLLIPEAEREALIATLGRERPEVLARVVDWVDRFIERDLARLDPTSPAAVGARVLRARLWACDPVRRRKATRAMGRLAREGYGSWVAATTGESERVAWRSIRFERLRTPGAWGWLLASIGLAAMVAGAAFLARPAWRPVLEPVQPLYAVLTAREGVLGVGETLRFCDRYQLVGRFNGSLQAGSSTSDKAFDFSSLSLDVGTNGFDRGVWSIAYDPSFIGLSEEVLLTAGDGRHVARLWIPGTKVPNVPKSVDQEPADAGPPMVITARAPAGGKGAVEVRVIISTALAAKEAIVLYRDGTATDTAAIYSPTTLVGGTTVLITFQDKVPRPGRHTYQVRTRQAVGGVSSKTVSIDVPAFKAPSVPASAGVTADRPRVVRKSTLVTVDRLANGTVRIELESDEALKPKELVLYRDGIARDAVPTLSKDGGRIVFEDKVPSPGRYAFEVRTRNGGKPIDGASTSVNVPENEPSASATAAVAAAVTEISAEPLENGTVRIKVTVNKSIEGKDLVLERDGAAVAPVVTEIGLKGLLKNLKQIVFTDKVSRPGRYTYWLSTLKEDLKGRFGGQTVVLDVDVPPFEEPAASTAEGVPGNLAQLIARAEKGDAEAQNAYGEALESGKGATSDSTRAVALYKRAADQGNAKAQSNMGRVYELGIGVASDPAGSLYWYQKAAAQGEPRAVAIVKRLRTNIVSLSRTPEEPAGRLRADASVPGPASEHVPSVRDAGTAQPAQRAAADTHYEFALMYEGDPAVEKVAATLRERLLAAGFKQSQFDRVTAREELYAYDRKAGHSYLDFHSTVPKGVRDRVLPIVQGLVPDVVRNPDMGTASRDYFLIWLLAPEKKGTDKRSSVAPTMGL